MDKKNSKEKKVVKCGKCGTRFRAAVPKGQESKSKYIIKEDKKVVYRECKECGYRNRVEF